MNEFSIGMPPISGESVSKYLSSILGGKELCIVRDIETLCTNNCEGLGELWREVSVSRNVEIAAYELISILGNADQIVTLHISIKNSPNQELVIDDGELVENTVILAGE